MCLFAFFSSPRLSLGTSQQLGPIGCLGRLLPPADVTQSPRVCALLQSLHRSAYAPPNPNAQDLLLRISFNPGGPISCHYIQLLRSVQSSHVSAKLNLPVLNCHVPKVRAVPCTLRRPAPLQPRKMTTPADKSFSRSHSPPSGSPSTDGCIQYALWVLVGASLGPAIDRCPQSCCR